MRMSDQLLLSDTPCDRDVGEVSDHDLADARQLISDLAALLDAGLLVVHEHVLGPARYGVGMKPGPT
jgi:hypothetical protein